MTPIETVRLRLRPLTCEDVGWLMALESDPEVMRYLDGGRSVPPRHPTGGDGFLRPRGFAPGIWAIVEAATAQPVGWVSLVPADGQVVELGYRLARSAWGRGYASEAAGAVIDATRRGGRLTVTATTMAVNVRSRRVLERLGMRLVRTVHEVWPDPLPGSEEGDVVYERTWG